jgi:TolB protein
MAADGSGQRRLTDHPQDDTKPRWATNDQLLWIRQIATRRTVWRAGADGAHPHPIRGADDRLLDHDLVVSPDGRRVAVITQTEAKKIDLVVVDLGTKREVSLGGEGVDEMPSWSPDGKWLVWSSTRSGDPELWVGSADGAHIRPLTKRPGADWLPRWVGGR